MHRNALNYTEMHRTQPLENHGITANLLENKKLQKKADVESLPLRQIRDQPDADGCKDDGRTAKSLS